MMFLFSLDFRCFTMSIFFIELLNFYLPHVSGILFINLMFQAVHLSTLYSVIRSFVFFGHLVFYLFGSLALFIRSSLFRSNDPISLSLQLSCSSVCLVATFLSFFLSYLFLYDYNCKKNR